MAIRIRLWLRLPHGRHRLLSIGSASGASSGALGLCSPVPSFRAVLWPSGLCRAYAYILVSGHSLPEVLLLAPFGPSWSPEGGGGGGGEQRWQLHFHFASPQMRFR